jgi:hypothetical protein
MEGHPDPEALEGLLFLELIADRGEDGHVVSGPFDPAGAALSEFRHRGADARESISAFR